MTQQKVQLVFIALRQDFLYPYLYPDLMSIHNAPQGEEMGVAVAIIIQNLRQ